MNMQISTSSYDTVLVHRFSPYANDLHLVKLSRTISAKAEAVLGVFKPVTHNISTIHFTRYNQSFVIDQTDPHYTTLHYRIRPRKQSSNLLLQPFAIIASYTTKMHLNVYMYTQTFPGRTVKTCRGQILDSFSKHGRLFSSTFHPLIAQPACHLWTRDHALWCVHTR